MLYRFVITLCESGILSTEKGVCAGQKYSEAIAMLEEYYGDSIASIEGMYEIDGVLTDKDMEDLTNE